MIEIERIRMHLPAGFEHRAVSIARRVGQALANQQPPQDRFIDRLQLAPQRLSANNTDEEIAQMIVNQILAASRGEAS